MLLNLFLFSILILFFELLRRIILLYMHIGEEKRGLSWEERLQIALDISHGIEYLHEGVSCMRVFCFLM